MSDETRWGLLLGAHLSTVCASANAAVSSKGFVCNGRTVQVFDGRTTRKSGFGDRSHRAYQLMPQME